MWLIYTLLALAAMASCVMAVKTRKMAWMIPLAVSLALIVAIVFTASWWWYVIIAASVFGAMYLVTRRYEGKPVGRSAVVLASLILATIAFATFGTFSSSAPKAVATTTPNADTIKALTVSTANYTCATDGNGLVAYDIGAIKSVAKDGRKWSDAVSTPLTASHPAGMVSEIMATVCKDPLYGSHVANFLANWKLGKFAVVSANPWLNEFKGDGATIINAKAAGYIKLLNKKNPTEQEVADAAAENKKWQGVAGRINTILSKLVVGKVRSDTSVLNYHLLGGGLTAWNLPAIGLNDKQEKLPAVQLFLTQKGQRLCLAKIGFNTGDGRLEQFKCTTPPKEPTPAPSKTPGQPGCKHDCTATTPPPAGGCDHTCETTPPSGCKHDCTPTTPPRGKDPNKDPAPQGNAPEGGGRNEDSGPGDAKPYNPPPANHYTPPAAPAAPQNPPAGSTPPPAETGANPGTGGNDEDPGGF